MRLGLRYYVPARVRVRVRVCGLSTEVAGVLLEYNEENNQSIDLEGRSGTRNAKRLLIVAAPVTRKVRCRRQSRVCTLRDQCSTSSA
jgi:hypothetical protein